MPIVTNKQLLKINSGSKHCLKVVFFVVFFFFNRNLKSGMISGWPEWSARWRFKESASLAEINGTAEDIFTC